MSRAKKKLSLNRETLRVLNAAEITLVAGAGANWVITDSPGCEKSGVVGNCEQPSHMPGNCGPCEGPRFPNLTVATRERLPTKSAVYCLDKPPMTGRTLPPTVMD